MRLHWQETARKSFFQTLWCDFQTNELKCLCQRLSMYTLDVVQISSYCNNSGINTTFQTFQPDSFSWNFLSRSRPTVDRLHHSIPGPWPPTLCPLCLYTAESVFCSLMGKTGPRRRTCQIWWRKKVEQSSNVVVMRDWTHVVNRCRRTDSTWQVSVLADCSAFHGGGQIWLAIVWQTQICFFPT